MTTTALSLPTALLYLTSGFLTGLRLFRRSDKPGLPRVAVIGMGLLGVLLHAVVLYSSVVAGDGLNLGFFNAVSIASWTVILLLLVSALNKPVENLGIILLPFAALSVMLAWRFPAEPTAHLEVTAGLRFHILISILAYSIFTLAAVQAVLLAVQDARLRRHHPGGFVRALPPLQTMEALLFELIGVGFALLTLGLVSGAIFVEDLFAQHLVHKTVLSIVSWLVFGILLWGRYRFGWRGTVAIRWTLSGFAVLVLAYFGSKAVLELILAR